MTDELMAMARAKALMLGGLMGEFIRGWVEALAGDPRATPDLLRVTIAEADRLGYRNYGEMARVDLALALARAGRDASAALSDVLAIEAEMGMVPLLGPNPGDALDRATARLINSHAHIQAGAFAGDAASVLDAARSAGAGANLVPGWDLDSSRASVAFAGHLRGRCVGGDPSPCGV